MGRLPLKLFGAVAGGALAALRHAKRHARRRLVRQKTQSLLLRQADQRLGLPIGADFRAEMGRSRAGKRQSAFAAPADRPVMSAGVTASSLPATDVDRRCAELEQSLYSGRRF